MSRRSVIQIGKSLSGRRVLIRLAASGDKLELVDEGEILATAPLGGGGDALSRAAFAAGAREVHHDYDGAIDETHRQPTEKK